MIDGDEPLSLRALELSGRFLVQFLREYARLPRLEGHRVKVRVTRAFASVTLSQHGFYRGKVLPYIAE